MTTTAIILAAGQGTRMNSDLPKVLHEIGAAPLLAHVLQAAAAVEPARMIVVTGHGAAAVEAAVAKFAPMAECVLQEEQRGTGHAVLAAKPMLGGKTGDAIVLFGDTPFIRPETLAKMVEARAAHDIVVLGFEPADPGRYGRLVTKGESLEAIVEWKDADEATRAIKLCNSGVIAADLNVMLDLLSAADNNNAAGEIYLTDIVSLARKRGLSATTVLCDATETLGINTRAELAKAEAISQANARAEALENGVGLVAPDTVHFAFDTYISRDAIVEQQVIFGLGVTVENGARIRAFSHLEGAQVSMGAVVGPYARLRPGTELAEFVKVGNFVEIKNAIIADGAKVSHLSYIGDAEIGRSTNVGAGTVTCNYDGVFKHRTVIGENCFIGSNTMLIAPVTLGDESMTASGSVITRDVPEAALAIGRARQDNKLGLARRMFEKLKNAKEKLGKGS
ncbi:MAG: bifunctional UDP-N-acetylglucosamine diphosphorylase/glucosamine-1-phosphate N-acetyltransferase GlmU [Rhodobacteraceae bacterium]|nr:bifunctional UDP-N-acetylglucosamine diphosphorylase/glucosamine-1-phosphate N-acetyltransferase GlmU [Paracoccaceae bacterium]